MSKHTPGPWTAQKYNDGSQICIESSEFGDIADVIYCRGVAIDEANARLIAAAPELLAACKLALARIDPDYAKEKNGKRPRLAGVLEPWAREACDGLRAAITKATA